MLVRLIKQENVAGAVCEYSVGVGASQQCHHDTHDAVVPVQRGNKVFIMKGGLAAESMVNAGERTDRTLEILRGIGGAIPY